MSIRFASFVAIPAVLFAGVLAFRGAERAPEVTPVSARATVPPLAGDDETLPSDNAELPPNHPPIGTAMSPHGALPTAPNEAPAISWKMPAGWKEAPNPNAMRLATYLAPGGIEVSVSRAGGATEANIQRWTAQFADVGQQGRAEKVVHGLHVVTVDIAGTYVGGGPAMGAPAEARAGWAMVGAIVESASTPYFFKMTGPAASVRATRPAFDRLVDGIVPM
jgi:hypothetical protein